MVLLPAPPPSLLGWYAQWILAAAVFLALVAMFAETVIREPWATVAAERALGAAFGLVVAPSSLALFPHTRAAQREAWGHFGPPRVSPAEGADGPPRVTSRGAGTIAPSVRWFYTYSGGGAPPPDRRNRSCGPTLSSASILDLLSSSHLAGGDPA